MVCGAVLLTLANADAALPGHRVAEIFVSATNGNDQWSGRLPAPNRAGTDGPLRTLDAARVAVRAIDKSSVDEIDVRLRGGTYPLAVPVVFDASDSGTATTPIVYASLRGETAVLSGGMRVTGWTQGPGNVWTTRLPANASYFEDLYYNGARRLRPRLGGYLGTTTFRFVGPVFMSAQEAGNPLNANCPQLGDGRYECFDRFIYDPGSVPISAAWKNLTPPAGSNPGCSLSAGSSPPAPSGDIEILVFEQFNTSKLRVRCIDTAKSIVYLTGPTDYSIVNASESGFIAGDRFIVENVRDAFTEAGQWFLDRSAVPWTLSYRARSGENPNIDEVIVPQGSPDRPQLVVASGLQYVTFRDLVFEHDNFTIPDAGYPSHDLQPGIPAAVSMQNVQNLLFDAVIVRHTSGAGVEVISCAGAQAAPWCVSASRSALTTNVTISNSTFYDLGGSGIRVGEPANPVDNDDNVPHAIYVENNLVAGYGRIIPASFGIGQGNGHDNQYLHNEVHDGYHVAISICACEGNAFAPTGVGIANHLVAFNHVYDLMQGIMNDGGAIRIAAGNGNGTGRGNRVLNNRVHDVSDASIFDANGYGGVGIYLDNQTGAVTVSNNLVYRVSGNAVYTPHGPAAAGVPNVVTNNILAFARRSMIAVGDPYPNYPELPPSLPQSFTVSQNVFLFDGNSSSRPPFYVQGDCVFTNGTAYVDYQRFAGNLYWRVDGGFASDPNAFHVQPSAVTTSMDAPCSKSPGDWSLFGFDTWRGAYGEDAGSVVRNPGFVAAAYPLDDYRFAGGAPLPGFVPFDVDAPGRTWPFSPFRTVVEPTFVTARFNPATDF